MISEWTVKEAAARWNRSERSVQLLCKQGHIPGARKIGGIWLLPADSPPPGTPRREPEPLHPEQLYGRSAAVRICSAPGERPAAHSGCTITQYRILDGITLVFQEIHEEALDYADALPRFPGDLIAIQHCLEGRFEGEYPNGECIYMGPGSLSVNLPAWSPVSHSFPLRHYRGLYIAIQPGIAQNAVLQLEAVLGPLHIDFSALSGQLSGKNRMALCPSDPETAQLLASLYPSDGPFREEVEKLRVLELLALLCTRPILCPGPEQYFPRDQVRTVKEIRRYLSANPARHLPLPELAARFRISLTGMKTCFRGVYGQSIGAWLREYRMQTAAELLRSSGAKMIEIAAAVGYENASKFSKTFAGFYGMTPSAYRKTFCPDGAISDRRE